MTSNVTGMIIAIDPGYDRVGWSVGTKTGAQLTVVEYGIIQTQKSASIFERYHQIETELEAIVSRHQPDEAALETLFFSKNQTTAMRVAEARGLILATLIRRDIHCFEYGPGQIKQAVTGYGKADKKAIEKMVRLQLKLPTAKLVDDTLDALAILLTHASQLKIT